MKRRVIAFSLGLAMMLGTAWPGHAQSEESNDDVLKKDWLYLPERALVFDVRYGGLTVHCRPEAGELAQGFVRQLLRAGYTIHFSRDYVRRELEYFEAHQEDEPKLATARGLASALRETLKQGYFDWTAIRQIHLDAPDSEAVTRGLPWLFLHSKTDRLVLAAEDESTLPRLEFFAEWEGRLTRNQIYTGNGVIEGVAYLWKIDAWTRLYRDDEMVVEKNYPAPPWLRSYAVFGVFPLTLQVDKIMKDLSVGLENPPPVPEDEPPKKKKRKFLFF